ncbi:MAG TPA: PAS domain-containing protein [Rhizomicrobium sp.]|jgi:hypothetical protein
MPTARAQHAAEDFNRFAERMAMPGRCDPTLSFVTPELSNAAVIWREKAAGREMPLRRDVNARTLKTFLPHVMIVDIVEDHKRRRYRIRLSGTSISGLLGDHTGKFIDEAIVSPFRERWSAVIDAALSAREPLRIAGRLEYCGQDYLSLELLLAPIGTRDEAIEAVLVVGYARSSATHVINSLVRNTVSGATANQSALAR